MWLAKAAPGRCVLLLIMIGLAGCAWGSNGRDVSYSTAPAVRGQPNGDRPPSATVLYGMARILAARGKNEECGFALARIINEYPKFLPAYCELAELHLREARVDEAIAVLVAGLKMAPDDPTLLNNLGMCHLCNGQHEAALGAFTRAAAVKPHDARYRANIAVTLGLMRRYEEALALYKQVVPLKDAYHNLGVLCNKDQDVQRPLASDDGETLVFHPSQAASSNHPEAGVNDQSSGGPEAERLAATPLGTP